MFFSNALLARGSLCASHSLSSFPCRPEPDRAPEGYYILQYSKGELCLPFPLLTVLLRLIYFQFAARVCSSISYIQYISKVIEISYVFQLEVLLYPEACYHSILSNSLLADSGWRTFTVFFCQSRLDGYHPVQGAFSHRC